MAVGQPQGMELEKKDSRVLNQTKFFMRSIHRKAIEAIEVAAKIFGQTINIRYQNSKKTVNRYKARWVITVSGNTFYDEDFITAVRKALVYLKKHNK